MSECPKINEAVKSFSGDRPFVSIEFFPPKTEAGINGLYKTLETYTKYDVLFADFTWGAGGSTSDLTLKLCLDTKAKFGINPNMHLTCTNMQIEKVNHALDTCKEMGIANILALRGDPPAGETVWKVAEGGLTCALDLVKYIRNRTEDHFCITVAGYPEGHPTAMTEFQGEVSELSAAEQGRYATDMNEDGKKTIYVCRDESFKAEIAYLKEKVLAGANMIITQMFFDVEVFKAFVASCRAAGITVPIIPGIMPIANYGGFKRMIKFCKTRVSQALEERIEGLKDDLEGLKAFGVEFGVQMCRDLLAFGIEGLHFYTLNATGVTVQIMEQLGYLPIVQKPREATEQATEAAAVATA